MADDAIVEGNNRSGIYAIICVGNNKRYVGQARDIKKRWADHRKVLRANKHYNKHLQRSFAKYGESSFIFTVIESCAENQLTAREQFWLDCYGMDNLFNCAPAANSTAGLKYSEEAKANLRRAAKLRNYPPKSEAERARSSALCHRLNADPAIGAKISAKMKGRKWSAEQKARISALRKGKPKDAAARARLLGAAKRPRSAATRHRMSETWKKIWAERKAALWP